ncbi:hypothetical protein [Geomonas ferrireducens]|uniref:hypothetical protein n=1 Tax=Geomonas ferrireducens TaxID=2570227 RepID=UPI0010A761CC|nr:hypothetical protein [Geomonas ferrireducens]
MRSTRITAAVAAALTGAVLTITPMASRGAEQAPHVRSGPVAAYPPGEASTPDAGAAGVSDRSADRDVEMPEGKGLPHQVSVQGDPSGALLEDLIRTDQPGENP